MNKVKSVAVMASGDGSVAQAVFDAFLHGELAGVIKIEKVISDQPEAGVLNRAKQAGIPTVTLPIKDFANRAEWNQALIDEVAKSKPWLVISAGFMRILSPDFVNQFRTINTHPALLPAFPGAHAVADALAAGVEVTGATVHFVDEGVDTGQIIKQVSVRVHKGDNQAQLHERIKIEERKILVQTIRELVERDEESV
ncbi:MAG: phosphoribosylglycinamide formyltransferase [Actinobacteria bacterium]|nr:phosphoribosylglycinamide formyltransferase [Actinomycetota bacterium]